MLAQSLQPHEIIIVDDASSDNSREIINGFKSRYPDKINTIFNEQNLGISKTRNIALKQCKEDIITFLDSDDYFSKDKLLSEYKILSSKKNLSVVYSNFNYITSSGEKIGAFSEESDKLVTGNIFRETFVRQYNASSGNNYIYEMYYKSCGESIGFYDENIQIWEDWDFRIRMSKKVQYGYCPYVNSTYRKLENGLHNSESELHYREQIKIYNKNKHLMSDLEDGDKRVIHNKVYSRLKGLFISVSKKTLKRKKYFRFIMDLFEFLLTFKKKKALGFILREF